MNPPAVISRLRNYFWWATAFCTNLSCYRKPRYLIPLSRGVPESRGASSCLADVRVCRKEKNLEAPSALMADSDCFQGADSEQ